MPPASKGLISKLYKSYSAACYTLSNGCSHEKSKNKGVDVGMDDKVKPFRKLGITDGIFGNGRSPYDLLRVDNDNSAQHIDVYIVGVGHFH